MPQSRFSTFALGTEPLTYVPLDDARRLYDAFRAAGQTTFDTAHCYTYWNRRVGSAERRLGELVSGAESSRDDVFVITKGGHIPVPGQYDVPDRYLSPDLLTRQLAESLDRLNLPHIDLYLLHRDDPRVPAAEHLAAVQPFLAAGMVRRIGVSNWTPDRITAANAFAAENNYTPFTACEAFHNLAHIPPERRDPLYPFTTPDHLHWYRQTQFPMLAFSSGAWGYFTDKPRHKVPEVDNPTSRARRSRAESLAQTLHATPHQIALAYLLASPFPCTPIFATNKESELHENLAATRIHLTPDQRRFLVEG